MPAMQLGYTVAVNEYYVPKINLHLHLKFTATSCLWVRWRQTSFRRGKNNHTSGGKCRYRQRIHRQSSASCSVI